MHRQGVAWRGVAWREHGIALVNHNDGERNRCSGNGETNVGHRRRFMAELDGWL